MNSNDSMSSHWTIRINEISKRKQTILIVFTFLSKQFIKKLYIAAGNISNQPLKQHFHIRANDEANSMAKHGHA